MSRELQAELDYYNSRLDQAIEACRVADEDYSNWWALVEYKQQQLSEALDE